MQDFKHEAKIFGSYLEEVKTVEGLKEKHLTWIPIMQKEAVKSNPVRQISQWCRLPSRERADCPGKVGDPTERDLVILGVSGAGTRRVQEQSTSKPPQQRAK